MFSGGGGLSPQNGNYKETVRRVTDKCRFGPMHSKCSDTKCCFIRVDMKSVCKPTCCREKKEEWSKKIKGKTLELDGCLQGERPDSPICILLVYDLSGWLLSSMRAGTETDRQQRNVQMYGTVKHTLTLILAHTRHKLH